jgi:hypothetical protein
MTSAPLPNTWTLYHHDPENKDWDMSGYDMVMSISRTEEAVALCNHLSDDSIKHTMWFLMKDPIQPRWEDPENITGGYYQYRVANKYAVDVWRALFLHCCSGELCLMDDDVVKVNGVSIAPRAYFCTIKIWLNRTTSDQTHRSQRDQELNRSENGSCSARNGVPLELNRSPTGNQVPVDLSSDQLFIQIPNLTHYGPPTFVANARNQSFEEKSPSA